MQVDRDYIRHISHHPSASRLSLFKKLCAKLVDFVLTRVLLGLLQLNQTPFTSTFLPHCCFLTARVAELACLCPLVKMQADLCAFTACWTVMLVVFPPSLACLASGTGIASVCLHNEIKTGPRLRYQFCLHFWKGLGWSCCISYSLGVCILI